MLFSRRFSRASRKRFHSQTAVVSASRLPNPDYTDRGKTVTQCKPRGKHFRERSIGLYLVGRHPIRSKGGGSHGPGLSVTSTSPCPQALGLASRSHSQEGKAGAIPKPAHRNATVSQSRRGWINPSDRT